MAASNLGLENRETAASAPRGMNERDCISSVGGTDTASAGGADDRDLGPHYFFLHRSPTLYADRSNDGESGSGSDTENGGSSNVGGNVKVSRSGSQHAVFVESSTRRRQRVPPNLAASEGNNSNDENQVQWTSMGAADAKRTGSKNIVGGAEQRRLQHAALTSASLAEHIASYVHLRDDAPGAEDSPLPPDSLHLSRLAQWRAWRKRLWHRTVTMLCPPGMLVKVFKGSLPYFICVLLSLIDPVVELLGPSTHISVIFVATYEACAPIGAHLEMLILATFELGLCLIYMSIMFLIAAAVNRAQIENGHSPNGGRWVGMAFLLVGIFWVAWARARFPRLKLPGNGALITLSFGMTSGLELTAFHPQSLIVLISPQILGVVLSLLANVLIFPETSGENMRNATCNMIRTLREQLDGTTREFLIPSFATVAARRRADQPEMSTPRTQTPAPTPTPSTYTRPVKMAKTRTERIADLSSTEYALSLSMPALRNTVKQASYEISISQHAPRDYRELANKLSYVQQHLSSMVLALRREDEWLRHELSILQNKSPAASPPSGKRRHDTPQGDSSAPLSPTQLAERLRRLQASTRLGERGDVVLLARIVDVTRDAITDLTGACSTALDRLRETVKADTYQGSTLRALIGVLLPNRFRPMHGNRPATMESGATLSLPERGGSDKSVEQLLDEALARYDIAESKCAREITTYIQDAGPRDELFLVFGFLYSLRELAFHIREMLVIEKRFHFVETSDGRTRHRRWRLWWPSVGLRKWLKRSEVRPSFGGPYRNAAAFVEKMQRRLDDELDESTRRSGSIRRRDSLEMRRERTINSTQTGYHSPMKSLQEARLSAGQWVRTAIWHALHWCQSFQVKYAFKTTLCALLISLPAFVSEESSALFQKIHGQWALVMAMLVISVDMGSTYLVGTYRVLGTLYGILWAIIVLESSLPKNPYVIGVMMAIHGIICWRLMHSPKVFRLGLIGVITTNSIVFGHYSGPYSTSSVFELSMYRGVTALVAVIMTIIISVLFWPFVARSELRKLLSLLIHECGRIYAKLAALRLLDHDDPSFVEVRAELDHLIRRMQTGLARATVLLISAGSEPRLKGPFPADIYLQLIQQLRYVCAWTVNMASAAVQSDPAMMRGLEKPVLHLRKDLTASILLCFHVLAGSLRTKLPLPAYLPSARAARLQSLHSVCPPLQRLDSAFTRVHEDDAGRGGDSSSGSKEVCRSSSESALAPPVTPTTPKHEDVTATCSHNSASQQLHDSTDDRYIYWYAYATGMSEFIRGQERVGDLVRQLVGVDELMVVHMKQE
ncbi:hypothetical protein THASP1DRAFT_32172 [Thamnocephalis sphaerospora]|uniref:ER transporter 6TM N-terminal domain-containing protein n=1 Tax=Thamnocephalis sphaerospora TaxID=78915 RepID=A0A4P9XKN7_9FUNG|nr:hypothetical protein THASP1DRAFT_32172 [Thamnocephalis sphaerospora]|eukprot:RKP06001.1 hypothetical protein THASP1DRAFT_32172 [Thamnocephalis sphaerospora]